MSINPLRVKGQSSEKCCFGEWKRLKHSSVLMQWKLRKIKAHCLVIQEARNPGLHWGGGSTLEPNRMSLDSVIRLLHL